MRLYIQQLEERVRQLTGENERLMHELNRLAPRSASRRCRRFLRRRQERSRPSRFPAQRRCRVRRRPAPAPRRRISARSPCLRTIRSSRPTEPWMAHPSISRRLPVAQPPSLSTRTFSPARRRPRRPLTRRRWRRSPVPSADHRALRLAARRIRSRLRLHSDRRLRPRGGELSELARELSLRSAGGRRAVLARREPPPAG